MRTRIIVADDHPCVREMVAIVLASDPTLIVEREAKDGDEAVRLAASLQPEIVIMDIGLPGLCGLAATAKIRQRSPDVQVIILSAHAHHVYLTEARRAGAIGYVVKQAMGRDLVTAVHAARRGEEYVSPLLAVSTEGEPAPEASIQGSRRRQENRA